jgi:hypothetical protein
MASGPSTSVYPVLLTLENENVILHFNSSTETTFCLDSRGDTCISEEGKEAVYVTYLSSLSPFSPISLGILGNYIPQPPLLLGWDERRRKAQEFLPASVSLAYYGVSGSSCFSSMASTATGPSMVTGSFQHPMPCLISFSRAWLLLDCVVQSLPQCLPALG